MVILPLALGMHRLAAQAAGASPNEGHVSDGTYANKFFGFTYEVPQGLTPQSTPRCVLVCS